MLCLQLNNLPYFRSVQKAVANGIITSKVNNGFISPSLLKPDIDQSRIGMPYHSTKAERTCQLQCGLEVGFGPNKILFSQVEMSDDIGNRCFGNLIASSLSH